jgi:hypothetical protein
MKDQTTMTEHVPNDLSHLSDAEFHSLCPQGEHAPGPQPLSPAAQAVLDAFLTEWPDEALEQDRRCLAAALRAAASQLTSAKSSDKLRAIAGELAGHA